MDAVKINFAKHIIKTAPPWIVHFYKFFNNLYVKNTQLTAPKKFLKKMQRGDIFLPKAIYIETTNHCNSACIMCPHEKMKRQKGYMEWSLFKKIIDECRAFPERNFTFFLHKDGEPLLDTSLFQKISYIKESLPGAFVRFNSNASLLDETKAGQLLSSGIDSVTFGVDGALQETHEKIRRGINYKTVKNNLDKFFALKKSSRSKIKVIIQMVVAEENKAEIAEYKRQWMKKADFLFFKPRHSFLDMGKPQDPGKRQKKQLYFCSQPFDILTIYWNGDIGLCCWDYDNLYNLGNIKKDRIADAYNNEQFKKVRAAMCNKNCEKITPCNRCGRIYGQDIWA